MGQKKAVDRVSVNIWGIGTCILINSSLSQFTAKVWIFATLQWARYL